MIPELRPYVLRPREQIPGCDPGLFAYIKHMLELAAAREITPEAQQSMDETATRRLIPTDVGGHIYPWSIILGLESIRDGHPNYFE